MDPISRLKEELLNAKKSTSCATQFTRYYAMRVFALDTSAVTFRQIEILEHEVEKSFKEQKEKWDGNLSKISSHSK